MRVVVITGSRDWTAYAPIERALAGAEMLIVGDARGADAIALELALRWDIIAHVYCASLHNASQLRKCGMPLTVFEAANWNLDPGGAGTTRNLAMVRRAVVERDNGMDVQCFAAPLQQSKGTFHCARELRKAGFDVQWLRAA